MPSNITFASAVHLQVITANARMKRVNTMSSLGCAVLDKCSTYSTLVLIIRCVR